jgi:NAD(P)-dependent dehydrogenase (short-subunit alcohol dehydrogenase family)
VTVTSDGDNTRAPAQVQFGGAHQVDLSGRRALVTGSGQGIGSGIATWLAAAGATVAVNDLVPGRAEAQAASIRALGGAAVAAPFSVTDFQAVTAALDELGGVDILVNNAGNAGGDGWSGMAPFAQTEPSDWEPFLAVNLYGVMHCVRAALPAMIAGRWGRIVTIISDSARVGEPNMAAYAAAKAGAAGLTRSVSKEVGRHGITANCISLGTMRTPLTEELWANISEDDLKVRLRDYPVRRPGNPEDVAALVGYLVGSQSGWITGQTIPLNGGYSMSL